MPDFLFHYVKLLSFCEVFNDLSLRNLLIRVDVIGFLQKLSEEETATIDKICKEEANSYVLFDPKVIDGLYKRGLVYFDVPVFPDDRFKGINGVLLRI